MNKILPILIVIFIIAAPLKAASDNAYDLNNNGYSYFSVENVKHDSIVFTFSSDILKQINGTSVVYVTRRPKTPENVNLSAKVYSKGKVVNSYNSSVVINELKNVRLLNEIMSFQVISDPHFSIDYDPQSGPRFLKALDFIAQFDPKSKALVIPGDLTDYVYEKELFYKSFENYKIPETFIISLGNHDYQYLERKEEDLKKRFPEKFSEMAERYITLNKRYVPDQDKIYFDKWVYGHHFIVLNTQRPIHNGICIDEDQFVWLEEKLAENAQLGKPIFVTIHQSLKGTHPRSDEWSVGDADERLKSIFRKYPQVVLFSGHIHNGFGSATVLKRDYGIMVDLPSFFYNETGTCAPQEGYHVELYPDRILFRAVSYDKKEFQTQFDQVVMFDNKGVDEQLLVMYNILSGKKENTPLLRQAKDLILQNDIITTNIKTKLKKEINKSL